jgi:hypothetical protein
VPNKNLKIFFTKKKSTLNTGNVTNERTVARLQSI